MNYGTSASGRENVFAPSYALYQGTGGMATDPNATFPYGVYGTTLGNRMGYPGEYARSFASPNRYYQGRALGAEGDYLGISRNNWMLIVGGAAVLGLVAWMWMSKPKSRRGLGRKRASTPRKKVGARKRRKVGSRRAQPRQTRLARLKRGTTPGMGATKKRRKTTKKRKTKRKTTATRSRRPSACKNGVAVYRWKKGGRSGTLYRDTSTNKILKKATAERRMAGRR